jgi:uncharacterized protein YyaL (SSP411 family)
MSRNELDREQSAYLRGAAHQPVHWLPWSEAAFARARAEDKPILMDVGAVWCHWCHVIDHESYDDPAVAEIINRHFVAIKVDRDERPDIDARYQHAVSAITGQGGWPLTAFLTPDGKVFFGGTYFPPDDAYGRPGFKRVLLSVAAYYRERKDEAVEAAEQLHGRLAAMLRPVAAGPLSPGLLETAVTSIVRQHDPAHGGFGGAPKFPHTPTLALLQRRAFRTRDAGLLGLVTRTLEQMARGGIRDHLGGGFHRYSTDARWIVPHFEKMLYDNAGLLGAYTEAWQATEHPLFREVVVASAAFLTTVLWDPQGGFRGSQDADVGPQDDGSYFTWTEAEARALLTEDEFAAAAEHFHLTGPGEMHDTARRHVLFVDRDPDVIALTTHRPVADVIRLLDQTRGKLAAARVERQAPYVDPALYANWNGMAITAMLTAGAVFGDASHRTAALAALERFIGEAYRPEIGFTHTPGGMIRTLDDQVQLGMALITAYEVTADARYLALARATMDVAVRDFWDGEAFRDVPRDAGGPGLDVPHHPIQDSPTPSANGVAALALLRLGQLFGTTAERQIAERLLTSSAPGLAEHGLHASALFLALDEFLHEPAHVTIIGPPEDPRTAALHGVALRAWRPDRLISHHRDGQSGAPLPDAVQAMLARGKDPAAYVCAGTACAPPAHDPAALADTLAGFGRS